MKYSLIFWFTYTAISIVLCRIFRWIKYNLATYLIFAYLLTRLLKFFIFRRVPAAWRFNKEEVAIVTGSGSGIGCQIAQQLSARGAKVIWAARDLPKAKCLFDDVEWRSSHGPRGYLLHVDLASKASIEEFVERFQSKEKRLDLLVLSAAYHGPYRLTADSFEQSIGVNHLGNMYLCYLLMDMLKASAPSRIVFVGSDSHKLVKRIRFDDLMFKNIDDYGDWAAYTHSKLLSLMFVRELGKRLSDSEITVHVAHPGTPVLTTILRDNRVYNSFINQLILRPLSFFFCRSTAEAARTAVYCSLAPECAVTSGKYYENCVESTPSQLALDDEAASRLWDVSCDLLNIKRDWLL